MRVSHIGGKLASNTAGERLVCFAASQSRTIVTWRLRFRLTGKKFESFTLQPTAGYYGAKMEKSIVLEIVETKKKDVAALAKDIRQLNGQKSVLIMP